jgi:GT2 family glycosyltransferase
MAFSLSVVIPNYNGVNLLAQNLPYLYKALESSFVTDFEIIVADDASKDNSIDFLEKKFPDIIIVQNNKNVGFASNINSGIFKATKDLIFAMNTDIRLEEGYFLPLFRYFEYSDTFAVMGKVIAWENDDLQDSAKYPDMSFWSIKGTKNYSIKGEKVEKNVFFFCVGG